MRLIEMHDGRLKMDMTKQKWFQFFIPGNYCYAMLWKAILFLIHFKF